MRRAVAFALAAVSAFALWAYHEGSWGNNIGLTSLGFRAAEDGVSRDVIAVGYEAAQDIKATRDSVLVGKWVANNCVSNNGVVAIGHGAVQDSSELKNVVAIGKYELAAADGLRNTTSINSGQILASETLDVVALRTRLDLHPTNAPFCFMGGNTYIGGTGTTYIAGDVVFNGRRTVVDNSSYSGGGGGTSAKLAGSGDLADLSKIPYSTGDCHIFVSPNGSDSNNGSFVAPFRTIDRALRSVKNGPMENVVIGVYAGEYAYPSPTNSRPAAAKGVTIVGLEGCDKTKMSLVASGVDYTSATNATITTYRDMAVLIGGSKWLHVYGFTFDGRTVCTREGSEGSYAKCQFYSCRFTGNDAVTRSGRRYYYPVFANCVVENSLIDDGFQVFLNDQSGSSEYRYWYSQVFFACYIYDSVVQSMTKSDRGDYTSRSCNLFCDCEIVNSLVLDTKNKWRSVLGYSVTNDRALEDSSIVVKETPEAVEFHDYNHRPYASRTIFCAGDYWDDGALPWGADRTKDSFFCAYSNLYDHVDANIYPLDDAFQLFGIGYNNSLTRRFKQYLIEKNYQTKDNLGLVDKRNLNATVLLAEDDDLNIYSLVTTDSTRPLLATFRSAATAYAPNERIVSTSLSQNEYDWMSHSSRHSLPEEPTYLTISENPEDEE